MPDINNLINHDNENEFLPLYKEIALLIQKAKQNIQTTVNVEMILLYWNIGKVTRIQILKNKRAEYGSQAVEFLSKKLTQEYGKGYGRSNLFNMVKFYDNFNSVAIVQTASGQLSWSHFIELAKIDDPLKKEFYITICCNERWDVRTLRERINSMLYERTAISKKPEQTIINDLALLRNGNKMSPDLFFRDPYVLDFLNLSDTYSEKDLENAILAELERFILEMGSDFAFMARQKRITIDNDDYYIDLLFMHRKMKRLIVIELKLDKFKPEHKGQMELYLRWLDKYEKASGEESPLGIILCAEKSHEVVELMELDKSGIHVGQYLTELPPKEVFEEKLHKAIARAHLQLEQRGILEP